MSGWNLNAREFVPGQGFVTVAQPKPAAEAPKPKPKEQPKSEAPKAKPKEAKQKAQQPQQQQPQQSPQPQQQQQQPQQQQPQPQPQQTPPPQQAPAQQQPIPEDEEFDEVVGKVQDLTLQGNEDTREHLNVVFIGHVDAGKSTIAGNLLYLTGKVDQRTIEKYEREAKDKSRGTWFLAYILDTNEEERAKGKTVEVGKANFETVKRRYTILDAPGHKNYVPNMIGGAAQADVGILVISARQGEFEAGFERGGQTREHAMLAKTIGIRQLVVVVNKMDDRNWEKERYDEIVTKITTFLRKECMFSPKDFTFLPIAGFSGANLKEPLSKEACPWYDGLCLIDLLDTLPSPERDALSPFRLPVTDRYKEMGILNVLGKLEVGTISVGQKVMVMPNRTISTVQNLYVDDVGVTKAGPGENCQVGLSGIDEADIATGHVLCDAEKPVPCATEFEAQLVIVELLATNPLFTAGYESVIHIHTCCRECVVTDLIAEVDKKTKKKSKKKPAFVRVGAIVYAKLTVPQPVCVELFNTLQQMGRFTLRDKGKTIAIGKITKL